MESNAKILIMQKKEYTDFIPTVLGREACKPCHNFGPSVKNNYSFHYIVCGKGIFTVNGKTYSLGSGSVFIIRRDEVVHYTADRDDPWEYIYIGFSGIAAPQLDKIEEPVFLYEKDTFVRCFHAAMKNSEKKEELAISALFEIYAFLFGERKETIHDYAETVRNYIYYNYQNNIRVEDIASAIGLNRHYLTSLFKKQMGMTIIDYLIKVRMDYACRFLASGYGVAQTAAMVGYQDSFVFSKMFKSKIGISPREYQKSL